MLDPLPPAPRENAGLIVCRVVGWLLIAAALVFVGVELVASLEAGAYQGLALGLVWYKFDVASLNLTQAVVQRYLLPALWDPVIVQVLQWPGWAVFGVPGVAVVALCWRRRDRERRRFYRRERFAFLRRLLGRD